MTAEREITAETERTRDHVGLRGYFREAGPSAIITMTVAGPGTMAALITISAWGYSLIWAVLLSVVFAGVAIHLAARVACATGKSSVELLNDIHPALMWVMVLLNFIPLTAILSAQGNALAAAAATLLNPPTGILPFEIPFALLAAVLVATVCAVYFIRGRFMFVVYITWALFMLMLVSFIAQLGIVRPSLDGLLQGFVPQWPPVGGLLDGAIAALPVAALIGGAAGLYTYMYHGYALRNKGWQTPQQMPYANWDIFLHIGLFFTVFSMVVLFNSVGVLFQEGLTAEGIGDAAQTLAPLYGTGAMYVFVLGWIGAVFTTIAGNALLGWTPLAQAVGITPRMESRGFRIGVAIYTFVVAGVIGPALGQGVFAFLFWGLAFLTVVTPFGILLFAWIGTRKHMGRLRFPGWLVAASVVLAIVVAWAAWIAAPNLLVFFQ